MINERCERCGKKLNLRDNQFMEFKTYTAYSEGLDSEIFGNPEESFKFCNECASKFWNLFHEDDVSGRHYITVEQLVETLVVTVEIYVRIIDSNTREILFDGYGIDFKKDGNCDKFKNRKVLNIYSYNIQCDDDDAKICVRDPHNLAIMVL